MMRRTVPERKINPRHWKLVKDGKVLAHHQDEGPIREMAKDKEGVEVRAPGGRKRKPHRLQ